MASNEEIVNPEAEQAIDQTMDEAALNEEASRELAAMVAEVEQSETGSPSEDDDDAPLSSPQSQAERAGVIEALIFVSDEPLTAKTIADVLKEDKQVVSDAINALAQEFNGRNAGLQLREVAGGWQF